MNSSIITICGLPGSGKSSTALGVAKALGYKHFSSGDLFRKMAKDRGISIEEINKRAELERELDHELDQRLRDMTNESNLVIDSRTAFHWMPTSFKVFLKIDPHVAAERTFYQLQKEGRVSQQAQSIDDLYTQTLERTESEKKRFTSLYNLDYTNESHYDLVIDTEQHPLDEVVQMIVEAYRTRN